MWIRIQTVRKQATPGTVPAMELTLTGLFYVFVAATLAPVLLSLVPWLPLPSVVLEILLGVALGPLGEVKVDELMRTSVPHIFAVGDVTHRVQLTPVAIREGAAVATLLFGGQGAMADHTCIPTAVFSQPPFT